MKILFLNYHLVDHINNFFNKHQFNSWSIFLNKSWKVWIKVEHKFIDFLIYNSIMAGHHYIEENLYSKQLRRTLVNKEFSELRSLVYIWLRTQHLSFFILVSFVLIVWILIAYLQIMIFFIHKKKNCSNRIKRFKL